MTERLTIEQVAARTGMTVRNVREHQTRGLLPPPVVEGRKGWYDRRHVARLQMITELQSQGLNLSAIGWLLDRAPADAVEELTRLERALFAAWRTEEPQLVDDAQLAARAQGDPALIERAQALDLVRRVDDGRWEIRSPHVLSIGDELEDLGIPLHASLDVFEHLRDHADAIATAFVDLFVTHVWDEFEAEGRPADRWGEISEALERLGPIAGDALVAVFRLTMAEAIERRIGEQEQAVRRDNTRDSA